MRYMKFLFVLAQLVATVDVNNMKQNAVC